MDFHVNPSRSLNVACRSIPSSISPRSVRVSPWHVGVAAEAYAAALFARYGYDVSFQYGANQPEYDLIAVSGDKILKISVKGSQDGSWGLTQSFKKDCDYHEAIAKWLDAHHKKTIFCLVQFKNTAPNEMPRVYLASPKEIADRMNATAGGRGDTILYEDHTWSARAAGHGMVSYGRCPGGGIAVYDQSWEADGSTTFLQVVFFMETMYIHQSHSNCQPVLVLKEIVFLLIFLISIFESTLVFVYVHSVACRIKDTSGNI